jgi:hypothetical protein
VRLSPLLLVALQAHIPGDSDDEVDHIADLPLDKLPGDPVEDLVGQFFGECTLIPLEELRQPHGARGTFPKRRLASSLTAFDSHTDSGTFLRATFFSSFLDPL